MAAHLSATPVTGWNMSVNPATPLAHSFLDDGLGSVWMRLYHTTTTALQFELELTAAPGYTFQITDTLISLYQYNYAGGGRSIYISANGESVGLLYQVAGGNGGGAIDPDTGFGWHDDVWDALTARTDLTSLWVGVGSNTNGPGSNMYADLYHVSFDGNVIPVPEPWTACLLAVAGLVGWGCRVASTRFRHARSGR